MTRVFILAITLCVMTIVATQVVAQTNDVQMLPNYTMKLSIETDASKEKIWQLWTNVTQWKTFDERLEYSYLSEGHSFEKGAEGYVKSKGAPKSKFELIEVIEGKSFIEVLKLPLGQTIHLHRYFESSEQDKTIFTHEVRFKGGMKGMFHFFLRGSFKKDLKLVMKKMKEIAEQ